MDPVRYTVSEEIHLAYWTLQFDSSIKRAIVFLCGLVVVLAIIAFVIADGISALSVGIGGVIGAVIVTLATRFIVIPWQAAKSWRDYALLKEEMTITMHEDGFSIEQPSAHVDAKWSSMIAWHETDQLFAMYLNRQLAYVLPKDQVSAAHTDYARRHLIASGLHNKGTRRT